MLKKPETVHRTENEHLHHLNEKLIEQLSNAEKHPVEQSQLHEKSRVEKTKEQIPEKEKQKGRFDWFASSSKK